jgi:dTDP-4-amino-4,6-dideoxygalactose transaminase
LVINRPGLNGKAELAYEAGTNRREFLRGDADRYEWKAVGSKYFPSEIVNAFILGQLELADEIVAKRLENWAQYYEGLTDLQTKGCVELPYIPPECDHNAHIFYIKVADKAERDRLTAFLKQVDIYASFHYVPLHSSAYGQKVSRFHGDDAFTTRESGRLLRLPIYYNMSRLQVQAVIDRIIAFY